MKNRYDFLSLAGCHFEWKLLRFPKPSDQGGKTEVLDHGKLDAPEIPAGKDGALQLSLPARWKDADALALVASDKMGQELWTWTWETSLSGDEKSLADESAGNVNLTTNDEVISLTVGEMTASFQKDGQLAALSRAGKTSSLRDGPRVVFARPAKGDVQWQDANFSTPAEQGGAVVWKPQAPQLLNLLDIDLGLSRQINWAGFKLEISSDGEIWKTIYDATRAIRRRPTRWPRSSGRAWLTRRKDFQLLRPLLRRSRLVRIGWRALRRMVHSASAGHSPGREIFSWITLINSTGNSLTMGSRLIMRKMRSNR